MFLHTVLFYAKPGLSPEQLRAFEAGVRSLTAIPSVRWSFVGTPAATRRPVIDSTYAFKLVVAFDDEAGHDLYQGIDIHLAFIAECQQYWSRVQIYDAVN
jgi:hypothetical protein